MEIDPGSSSGASASEPQSPSSRAARTSSFVNQVPSAISPSANSSGAAGSPIAAKPNITERWERPGLAPEVSNAVHVNTDFFLDLADNTRFE